MNSDNNQQQAGLPPYGRELNDPLPPNSNNGSGQVFGAPANIPQPTPAPQPQQPTYQPPAVPQTPTPAGPPQQTATPAVKTNPNSTQNVLEVAEVRDGIVIMNDGSFRSVVMTKAINFDLMSNEEREGVEFAYQGFLNSLYFDIQILSRSKKVDLGPYIDKLVKIRSEHDNMLLAVLMDDYITYMDNLSLQTNIMDKTFFIVIPYYTELDAKKALDASKGLFKGLKNMFKPQQEKVIITEADLNAAKTELRNRVQAVLDGLNQTGVRGIPLDTQELIELYYDTYNPDTATRQQLKNFDDLTAPIITKGEGNARQPHLEKELQ